MSSPRVYRRHFLVYDFYMSNEVKVKSIPIHMDWNTTTYRQRVRAFRKTLSFRERHFTQEHGVIPFAYMSYKMWLTKIWGGFKLVILKMEDKK